MEMWMALETARGYEVVVLELEMLHMIMGYAIQFRNFAISI